MPYYRHVADGSGYLPEHHADQELDLTPASALLELRLATPAEHGTSVRVQLYKWCMSAAAQMKESPGWLPVIFRQLREDARELNTNVIVNLLFFAADHHAVDLRGFLDVTAVLEDRNHEDNYVVLPVLRAYIQKSPHADVSSELATGARAIFARHGFDDPFAPEQIT
jgi:hypothetical protein